MKKIVERFLIGGSSIGPSMPSARLLRAFTEKERAVFAKEVAIKFEVDEAEFAEELQLYLMRSVRPWLKKSDVKKGK